MKIKTSELIGAALDWAVCKSKSKGEVKAAWFLGNDYVLKYSTDWAQGGPIIEREQIDVAYSGDGWYAVKHNSLDGVPGYLGDTVIADDDGPTPLIAAMRCYVASKLGDEVEIPDEMI